MASKGGPPCKSYLAGVKAWSTLVSPVCLLEHLLHNFLTVAITSAAWLPGCISFDALPGGLTDTVFRFRLAKGKLADFRFLFCDFRFDIHGSSLKWPHEPNEARGLNDSVG